MELPSKKERMEALIRARKSREGQEAKRSTTLKASDIRKDKKESNNKADQTGYESESSIRSSEFVRTKEDDDFIDAEDDDPDARRELYAEQHFDDEEAEEADVVGKGKKKRKIRFDDDAALRRSTKKNEEDADNPIMMAVSKMKKKKKEVKKLSELEEEAKEFVYKMMVAATDDEEELKGNRPALKKMTMLPSVIEIAARREIMRPLLDNQFLNACGMWIQPLPNGKLGNVTLRSQLLRSIASMSGENGVSTDDLKRSGFGKKVMSIYMHKDETPEMKRFLKHLIEQWSRPVFGLTGNMKDLEQAQRGRHVPQAAATGVAYAMPYSSGSTTTTTRDFSTIITKGQVQSTRDLGNNRVRVPYSRGFQFTIRPESKAPPPTDEGKKANVSEEQREGLIKRIQENNRTKSKNYRSVNISVEGRAAK
jgi:transcription factor SPN1